MKVFCIKCKFFDYRYMLISVENGFCTHPDNLGKSKSRDTWREEGKEYTTQIRPPSEINALNDCKWFQPKED